MSRLIGTWVFNGVIRNPTRDRVTWFPNDGVKIKVTEIKDDNGNSHEPKQLKFEVTEGDFEDGVEFYKDNLFIEASPGSDIFRASKNVTVEDEEDGQLTLKEECSIIQTPFTDKITMLHRLLWSSDGGFKGREWECDPPNQ